MCDIGKVVYVVTSGSYSDYHIVGIFDNKELAELAAMGEYDTNGVDEYVINPDEDHYRAGLSTFSVLIDIGGNVISVSRARGGTDFCIFRHTDSMRVLRTAMWAKDEQHAIKIANERRAFLIAENMWPEAGAVEFVTDFPWEMVEYV